MKTSIKTIFVLAAGLLIFTACNNDDDDNGQPNTPGEPEPIGTVHCIEGGTEVVEVLNPETGRTWMDRNLGASQVAVSATDAAAFGDLYQWGRGKDGHQCRTSANTNSVSSDDNPAHGNFVVPQTSPWDWVNPQNDAFWHGTDGANNPCPDGFRLPTLAEWDEERMSWSSSDMAGAFDSPLKLTAGGYRDLNHGDIVSVDSVGYYWNSTILGPSARFLYFGFFDSGVLTNARANGQSVRCIKD